MIASAIVVACCICALIPACLFFINVCFFREPACFAPGTPSAVDVLIPARDEAANIHDVVRSVLLSRDVDAQVYVYDDNSTDATASIVERMAAQDARVHLVHGGLLPEGWNGKQHACWRLAHASSSPLLLFLDADVRLGRDAIARCVEQQQRSGVALLSGFPRIVMVTWMEWLLLPLIQFVLLGLLPMFRMRHTTKAAYAAGCGQFMLAAREAYFASGGHAAIRNTRHDGLKLPHLFREHAFRTDICDLTELAHVRMYRNAYDVWNGLAKNATEGLGSPGRIVPITLLLLFGQVVPAIIALIAVVQLFSMLPLLLHGTFIVGVSGNRQILMFATALLSGFIVRLVLCCKSKQPWRSAFLHPLGVLLLIMLQWYALVRQIAGRPVGWRARSYSSTTGRQVS